MYMYSDFDRFIYIIQFTIYIMNTQQKYIIKSGALTIRSSFEDIQIKANNIWGLDSGKILQIQKMINLDVRKWCFDELLLKLNEYRMCLKATDIYYLDSSDVVDLYSILSIINNIVSVGRTLRRIL